MIMTYDLATGTLMATSNESITSATTMPERHQKFVSCPGLVLQEIAIETRTLSNRITPDLATKDIDTFLARQR